MTAYVGFMRKHFIILLIILFHSAITLAQNTRPNIIYIMADDMGYADLSCYGRKEYSTPHLDKLASEGIKLMNAYAAAPVCTPTRTAFITGRYPARQAVGLREPLIPDRDSAIGLDASVPTIGAQLKNAGYETVLIGKWHLGFSNEFGPNRNGFDYFFGIRSGAADYVSHKGDGNRPDLFENENSVVVSGYLTDLFKQHAIDYIKQKHTKPFFLCLHFNAPHWPWQGPGDPAYPDTMRMNAGGNLETYGRIMKSLDDAIGEIMKTLEEQSMTKNTLVIFTSDNGGERFSDMGAYKGRKLSLWEGGIRVPAFVRWPGKIKPGRVSDQVCITMDWTATILGVAGAAIDKNYSLDGINLLPVLTGSSKVIERTLYWRTVERSHHKAMREGNWKYLQDEKGEYLFDLSSDSSESNNLHEKYRERFERLKNKYEAWEATILPSFVKKIRHLIQV
jgi:arylsulfatase A-like enzyme